MSIFNRKKKQLEAEWQLVEQRDGESIFDAIKRALIEQGEISKEAVSYAGPLAKGELRKPPSDGEWLMQAALQKLSMKATAAGLEAVRQSRKVGLN